jgi:putative multiple sugar transport system ATP-binding protein
VVNLSGGNQQKVVLAKWLFSRPEVLILDEPTAASTSAPSTRSTTSSAELAAEGKCIIMISSEMPELLGMCDRIYVMNEGQPGLRPRPKRPERHARHHAQQTHR